MPLVIKWGALAPCDNMEFVEAELERARVLRNQWIEIDCDRRQALRELDLSYDDVVIAMEAFKAKRAARELAYTTMATDRASKRSKEQGDPVLLKAYEDAKSKEQLARVVWQRSRAGHRNEDLYKEKRDAIEQRAEQRTKAASAESGVGWGTKQLHAKAMSACKSMKSTIPGKLPPGAIWDDTNPHDPHFIRRYPTEGMLGVQIQGGITTPELDSDTQLQMGPAWVRPAGKRNREHATGPCCPITPNGARSSQYRTLRIRLNSDPAHPIKGAIWATWPIRMSRELPAGCRITHASVHLKMCGPLPIWFATITVDPMAIEYDGRERRSVAVDIGWLSMDPEPIDGQDVQRRGIRVATWVDDQGNTGELRLTPEEVESMRRAERLQTQRDINLNGVLSTLRNWMDTHVHPKELREATTHMHSWKSAKRIVALIRNSRPIVGQVPKNTEPPCWSWEDHRFDGDSEIFDELVAWIKHDRHLWEYQEEQRAQGLARRKSVYHNFSAWLRRTYTVLCIEGKFVGKLAKRPEAEDTKVQNETARSNRQLVGTSYLRQYMWNAVLSGGPGHEIREVDPAFTTQTDPNAHVVDRFDTGAERTHTYQPSGETLDQDVAAARNILYECMRERSGDEENQGTARKVEITRYSAEKREGRFQKLKRLKAEKLAKETTAREERDKSVK